MRHCFLSAQFYCGSWYMLYLIERAKKCLDFSATLYIIHLFICIMYGGWPSSITWWVINVTVVAVMVLLGEYLCIRRELREIPITLHRSKSITKKFLVALNSLFSTVLEVLIRI
ncbi:regulator of telomere elongation helicase 1-like [Hibiscus syriacus]|uniref:Regulator of telomere elongation helicase 1-like n=1 Tax=Hibiscus syriacus TaxID=106335 RepID=A0A6A2ZXE4_HIBSY|nr:regulator of telomere elongation helicase 1-like [Hibiscus syriacus]